MTVDDSADACLDPAGGNAEALGSDVEVGGGALVGALCSIGRGPSVGFGPYFLSKGWVARMIRNVSAKTRSSRRSVPGSC